MATVDFASLLAKKADDCKPPPVLPTGTYRGIIQRFEFGTSRDKETPFVRFDIKFLSAEDDVEASELVGVDLSKTTKPATFYITDNSDYRLANFIKSCGVKTEGRSLNELIPEVVNAMVLVPISQRLDKNDPTKTFNDIGDIVGA